MRKTNDYAVETADTSTDQPQAYLTITKIIRENQALHIRKGYGETIGQMIDQHIASCLKNGDEIQEVTLEFSPEQWNAMR